MLVLWEFNQLKNDLQRYCIEFVSKRFGKKYSISLSIFKEIEPNPGEADLIPFQSFCLPRRNLRFGLLSAVGGFVLWISDFHAIRTTHDETSSATATG